MIVEKPILAEYTTMGFTTDRWVDILDMRLRVVRKIAKTLADLVRSPVLPEVRLKDLKSDDSKTLDQHFQTLYRSYCLGRLVGVLTRVDILKIYPGTYKRAADGSVRCYDYEAEPKHIDWMAYDIRRGFRPSLYLYKGIFGETIDGFVCSDDVLAYHGYRKLGVRFVPAIVLGRPKESLDESGIGIRIKDGREGFDSIIVKKRKSVSTLLGSDAQIEKRDPLEAIRRLKLEAKRATSCIKAFHIEAAHSDQIHYHHSLYSVAYRLVEVLQAIDVLLRNDLAYQIRPLVRSAYELFLNFYIDWLFPEKVGLVLQGLAQLSRIGKDDPGYVVLKGSIEKAFGGLADVCRSANEKGRLSPLGAEMHSQIYSALSPIVHQDFGVMHEYAGILDAGHLKKMTRQELSFCIRCLDLITAATITRLFDDVAAPEGKPKKWEALSPSRLRRVGVRRDG